MTHPDSYSTRLAEQVERSARDRVASSIEDLPLFPAGAPLSPDPYPKARRTDPETSHAAAASVAHHAAHVRAVVLSHLEVAGSDGRTADEIEQAEGWRAMTAARRLSELYEAGTVERGPDTRTTQSGRQALVYRVPSCVKG